MPNTASPPGRNGGRHNGATAPSPAVAPLGITRIWALRAVGHYAPLGITRRWAVASLLPCAVWEFAPFASFLVSPARGDIHMFGPVPADLRELLQISLGAAYTLERELGGGGMARVFVANEARLGRRVVIKVLNPDVAAAVSAERFEREMRVAARLQDPRIVPVLSAGDASGVPYYTMPFVDGESLRARMSRGRVSVAEGVAILRDIALALEHAHGSGVVHRDIKPENVLLSGGSRGATPGEFDERVATAVVTDFGIAKALAVATLGDGLGPREDELGRGTLTQAGISLGTPAYMAPEQALGDARVDARADIYAWGVVAHELLTGQHPFGARASLQSMVAAHLSEVAPPVAERAPDVPPALANLVDRALRKDPADRPPNAGELVRVLNELGVSGTLSDQSRRPATISRRLVGIGGIVAAVVAAVAALWWMRADSGTTDSAAAKSVRSIAVLPFIDARSDSGTAYLGSGMADALATTLAKLPQLRVVANRSAVTGGRTIDAKEAGEALKVDAVLEGSVTRLGDRLRIRAHLVRVADGTILWGDTYDRTASNMFELEDEVTGTIARELRGSLATERGASGSDLLRGTSDQEAYDLYLRGRYAWSKRGEQGLRTAIDLFNAALKRDPEFARAHAGLAMAWVVMPVFTTSVSADSALAMAQQSGNRALALDSSLADAHLAIAYALKMKWRWEEAERHFRTATALAPDDATAHHWYGVHLYAMGDVARSADELRRARELDPFGTTAAIDGANALYGARRFDEARAEVRRGLVLDSTRSDGWFMQGLIQLGQGRPDSAVTSFENARRFGTAFDMRAYLSVAHRRLGRAREADAEYAELPRDYANGRVSPYDMALAAVAAADSAKALAAIERMVDRRDIFATEVSFPCDPLFDALRSNPRFEQLLARGGMRCRR